MITLRLTLEQKQRLEKEAKRLEVSMGWVLRNAYFNKKSNTKYYKKEKQIKIKSLKH